jgi:hypothetical protein
MLRSRSASRIRHPIRIPEQQQHQERSISMGSARPLQKAVVARIFLPVLLLLILILMGLFFTMSSDTYTFVFRRTDPVARLIQQRLSERSAPNQSANDASTTAAATVKTTIRVFGPDAFDSGTWAAPLTATPATQTAVLPPLPLAPRILSSPSNEIPLPWNYLPGSAARLFTTI